MHWMLQVVCDAAATEDDRIEAEEAHYVLLKKMDIWAPNDAKTLSDDEAVHW